MKKKLYRFLDNFIFMPLLIGFFLIPSVLLAVFWNMPLMIFIFWYLYYVIVASVWRLVCKLQAELVEEYGEIP